MKPISLAFVAVFFTINFYAQSKIKGNKQVRVENTTVENFKTLSIGNKLEVVLIKSGTPSVTIEADDNLHSAINFSVNNGILNFQVTKRVTRSKEFKAIVRYTDSLSSIILNGNVDVEAQNGIQTSHLNLTLNDDAKIDASINTKSFTLVNNNDSSLKFSTNCKLEIECKEAILDLKQNSNNNLIINCENLDINTYENAELNIEGFSYNIDVEASQSSAIKGKELLSNNANLKLSDKADVSLNVSDSININASGNSKISLFGEPKINIEQLINKVTLYKKEL